MAGMTQLAVSWVQPLHPQSPKLLGLRNWCEVREQPGVPVDAAGRLPRTSGLLQFMLRLEDPERKGPAAESYVIPVPTYIPSKNAPGAPQPPDFPPDNLCFPLLEIPHPNAKAGPPFYFPAFVLHLLTQVPSMSGVHCCAPSRMSELGAERGLACRCADDVQDQEVVHLLFRAAGARTD